MNDELLSSCAHARNRSQNVSHGMEKHNKKELKRGQKRKALMEETDLSHKGQRGSRNGFKEVS